LSSDSQDEALGFSGELAQELRRFAGLGASLFRAAAARIGMTVTDMLVIDILDGSGPATAGQLAEHTGLTTGAITGMLNRLEEIGLVRRERDPADGRRVIVRLDSESVKLAEIERVLASMTKTWGEAASRLDAGPAKLMVEFLVFSNAVARDEITRLREGPSEGEAAVSAPMGGASSGRLVVSGASRLKIVVDRKMTDLYRARFDGPAPEVTTKEGTVAIRYPRRLWSLTGAQRTAEVTLGPTIPWQITVQGGAAEIVGEFGNLKLSSFEAKGGASVVRLTLPVPEGVVPVRLSGGAAEIIVRRPEGTAARAHLKGWASLFIFDEQSYSAIGNDVMLQSTDYDATGSCYSIEISSSASSVTISTV